MSCRWVAATTGGDLLPICNQQADPVLPDVHGLECRNCGSFHLEDVGSAFGVDDLVYASETGPGLSAECDPQCAGRAWVGRERTRCSLGFELAPLLLLLGSLARRGRR